MRDLQGMISFLRDCCGVILPGNIQLIYNSETGSPLTLSNVSFQYVRARKYKTDREMLERERVCLLNKERGGVGMSKIKNFSHNSLHPVFLPWGSLWKGDVLNKKGPWLTASLWLFFFLFYVACQRYTIQPTQPPFMFIHENSFTSKKQHQKLLPLAMFYPTSPTRYPLRFFSQSTELNCRTCGPVPKHTWQIF